MSGVDMDAETLSVRLVDGTVVHGLGYDDVCKVDEEFLAAKKAKKKADKEAKKSAKKVRVA
jgi:hypothetical protein